MHAMSTIDEICEPQGKMKAWHSRRFKAFELLQQVDRDIRGMPIPN